METVLCNLCGGNDERELYHSPKYRVVICKRCTLVYLNPRMNIEEYTRYYTEEYQKNRHSVTTYDEAILRLKQKGSYEKKKTLFPFIGKYLSKESKVLEIGSGWGTLLKVIKDTYGSNVSGIEISSQAVEVSRRFYGIPTENKTLENFCSSNTKERFDFIIMYHVLEHILNPLEALQALKGVLSKNGSLYIAVPNLVAPNEDLSLFFRIEHCYYFTPQTLVALLKKAGYTIVDITITPADIQVIVSARDIPDQDDVVRVSYAYSVDFIIGVVRRCRLKEYIKLWLRPVKRSIQTWLR